MKITFLFICFSVLATISLCQTYAPLEVPSTTPVTDFNPCSQNYYTFSIPVAEAVPTNYLLIDIESSSQIFYYLSPTNITFSNIITLPGNNQDTTIDVVCEFTEYTQWYLLISNEGDVQVDYNLTISIVEVNVTPLQIANTTDINTNGYEFDSFATSSDFYSLTFPQIPKQFSSLEVTITSNDVNNTISSAQINFDNLPATGCQTIEQGGETITLLVDYCSLQANQAGTYFISVTPENEESLSYTVEVTNPAPTVTTLPTGTAGLTGYLLVVDEINFYSVSASEGNVLNFTLTNIVNGELEINVNYGTLPFFECVNGAPIVSQETSTSCQLIVDYCNSISGVYYIGVQVKSIGDPSLPISYRIFYNQFSAPTAESLAENQYTTGVVSQSFYSHYEFENTDFDVTEDTLINIRLYVDTYDLDTSYQVNLYVNFDEPAGPNDSCWSSIEECSIVTGNDQSSCTIQIDPCLFNDHSNWYASVFASDDLIASRVIQYTIIATLENPLELTQQFEIVSSSVYFDNYDHYFLPESLFPLGYQVDILVTVSDRIQLYANADGTPAGAIVCPACYNNTDSLSTTNDITYSVVSCPGAEIEDDFYFSIQGQSQGAYSSYSVMYVLSTGLVEPLSDLAPDTLAVGSIASNSAVNYTLGIASFADENQLTIKLSSQNTTSVLTATLYNSLYLNCLEGTEMYSCTVGDTGYCTFTVPSCVFTTSDGLILSLSNSDDSNTAYYNVEFSNEAVPTTELENNDIIVSEIGQFQYDLYEYNVQSGASTIVIEVVFFDDGEYNPTGYLNVSTLALGTGPCYPDGEVFTCNSDSKCVFVASSCNLQSETLNIAVYTAYNLEPDLPLKYSIVVRQFSSISALPTASNSQSTFTGQIYPGQQVYHTFPASVNAALGSQVTFQLSGEVTGVVSQSPPPSTNSCPCFEYYPNAVLDPNGNTPVALTIEYCDQVATNTYTILVEANSDQNPAQQVTYTIVASTFSSTPVALTLDNVVNGQVTFGYYQYFTIPANVDVVSLSITNIVGGSIGIYYSNSGPATVDCSVGSLDCATPDSACVSQLPSCEEITYISVYGDTAESTSPITFNIVISGQNSTELTEGTLSANTTLDASFLSIFSYTLEDTTYTAPIVTFTLTNILPANGNYRISVYTNDLCSSDLITTTLSSTISIPYCQIEDKDLFFYVTSLETTRTIYFTAEITVVDVYEDNAELELNTPVVIDFTAGSWFTYEYAQPALDPTQQSSLTFTIDPPVSAYLSFGSFPTSQCSDATFTTTYTVSSCCLQEGTYYLAFTSPVFDNYTIEVVSTLIAFTETVTLNTPTDTITVPASQTAEFTFEITDLEYQTINIIVDSTETVDVSFERISQAGSGLGSCFTDSDAFTSGPGSTIFSIEKCEPFFIGTLYVAVTATTTDADVTLSVITDNGQDLTTDGTPVPLTADADITYVFQISVDQTDLLPNQELSIVITSNNVTFLANLYASSEYCSDNNNIGTCTDAESCTITYLLCNSVTAYTLSISANDDADISVTATIVSVTPTPLTAGDATDKPDDSITNLYSFSLTDVENSQYVTVTILYSELTNNFAASWRYNAAAPGGIFCLPTDDSENDCEEYTQDTTANTTTCTFNIEPCELYNGEFLLQIISNEADDQYEVTYTVNNAEPIAITIGQTIFGTIEENVNNYYQLPFDRSNILPGQSFEIQLDVTCGTADLYINQGLLAGPDCSISSALTYSLDACDLLDSSVTSSPDSDFFITIAGGQTDYPQFDVPTTYSLSSAISGNEIKFVPIGPNQAISYDGTPTIYTYNVAGINDFTGELAFTLSVNPEVLGAQATVYISADVPYHPLLPCTNQFQTLDSTQVRTTLYEDSCTVDSVRIFYISFDVTSSDNSTVMVSRTKQYVRDLNEYNYPQSGAVVGAPVNTEIVDEEYYEIEVDPTVAGFRFQATLNTPSGGWANLLTSIDSQPSTCNVLAPDTTCSSQNIDGECEVAIDYCEFTDVVLPHIFLTVNTQFDSAVPVPYNLTFTQTVTQTTLTVQQSICGSSNTTWSWYTLPSTATANTFYEFQVYSVSLNEFVDVYLNTEGLATDRCNQYSSTGCTGSCSIVYSCDGFNGQFSLGIEKNDIDTSYFVVVNTIKINPLGLALATSHDSDDDTPVTVGGTEYYFYSFNAPDLNEAEGQSLILTVSSETPVSVSYNTGSPSINCVDDESFGSNVVFFINSCDYATGTVYVSVSGSSDFTIEVSILSPTVTPIAINSYVEGSLFIDTTEDSFPAFASYSITLGENDIQAADSFTINVYGINQGALQIWISEGQVADFSCAVAVFAQDTVTLDSCDLTAGTYFVNVLLTTPGQTNPCTPVTFGILLTSNQPAAAYNFVTLNSGAASTSSVFFSNNVYSFTTASPSTSLVILTTTSAVPLTVSSSCDVVSSPVQYFFGCSAQPKFTFTVEPTLSTLTPPSTQYSITATTASIQPLSTTPILGVFSQEDYEALFVFQVTVTSEISFEVVVDVTTGPSVEIQLWSAECVDGANDLIETFTCYFGTCVLPVSQRQGAVANSTTDDVIYYITVSGYSPSVFDISVSQGESQTCSVPSEDDLQFCTIVDWSTWSYESDTNIIVAQDETAQRRFDYLYLAFCPPCVCEELSEACNSSLTEYVCTQTFRACDYDGFETSICLTSCQDVETNCGKTFEDIGLPELSCNHNFYLAEDDPICEDIYGTTSSNSELILWIVVGVVLFIVVVVLISVAVVVGYKQVQAKRRASSYEVLE